MIQSSVEEITPDMARELLERNQNNRRAKPGVIERIASDIKKGRWKLNGEAIIIAESGRLLDGQNRLNGCIKANMPIKSIVVRGAEEEVFDTLDSGASRTVSDVFKIRGEIHSATLANSVAILWRHMGSGIQFESFYPSPPAAEEVLAMCPGIREAVKMSTPLKSRLMPSSVVAALYYLFHDIDMELADKWFGAIAHGDEDVQQFNLLRQRLVKNQEALARLPRSIVIAYCIKAWNMARTKQNATRISLSPEEAFPGIK